MNTIGNTCSFPTYQAQAPCLCMQMSPVCMCGTFFLGGGVLCPPYPLLPVLLLFLTDFHHRQHRYKDRRGGGEEVMAAAVCCCIHLTGNEYRVTVGGVLFVCHL